MAQINCINCYDGLRNHCDGCNTYRLVSSVENMSIDELEHVIDAIESSERECMNIDELLMLKRIEVEKYNPESTHNKSKNNEGITW